MFTKILNFPTKRRAVRALAAQGLPPRAIAARIGSSPGSVSVMLSQLRAEGQVAEPNLHVPPHVLARLARAAEARGMTSRQIAAAILTAAAEDNLVTAILED